MPILAQLIAGLAARFFSFFAGVFGAQVGLRLAAATAVGAGYVAAVGVFSSVIGPWIGSVFNTSYGALLGLLFPPVAGNVLAALVVFWAAVIAHRYVAGLLRMVAG
jgi:hypothetical protein